MRGREVSKKETLGKPHTQTWLGTWVALRAAPTSVPFSHFLWNGSVLASSLSPQTRTRSLPSLTHRLSRRTQSLSIPKPNSPPPALLHIRTSSLPP